MVYTLRQNDIQIGSTVGLPTFDSRGALYAQLLLNDGIDASGRIQQVTHPDNDGGHVMLDHHPISAIMKASTGWHGEPLRYADPSEVLHLRDDAGEPFRTQLMIISDLMVDFGDTEECTPRLTASRAQLRIYALPVLFRC